MDTPPSEPCHLPEFQLLCLRTAVVKTTEEVLCGKITVVEFWKCQDCGKGCRGCSCRSCDNDWLNDMAKQPRFVNVQFVSVCCDSCDGAREIIEHDDELRWQAMMHYYLDRGQMKHAKEMFDIDSMPFYMVVNEHGNIIQRGTKTDIDFNSISGPVSQLGSKSQSADKMLGQGTVAIAQ